MTIILLCSIRSADAYHTCYNLAGLSSAQHTYTYDQQQQHARFVASAFRHPAGEITTTASNLVISNPNGEKPVEPETLPSAYLEQRSGFPSEDQSFFTSTLDAPYSWHADVGETEKEKRAGRDSLRNEAGGAGDDGDNHNGTNGTDGAHVENGAKNVPDIDGGREQKEKEGEEQDDPIGPMHPVFVVPWGVAEKARRYFEGITGF